MSILNNLGSIPTSTNGLNLQQLINQFGGLNNLLTQLNSFMSNKQINPKQYAINNLRNMHFSSESIEQFRAFAKQSGLTDEQIDCALREAGIIGDKR